MCVGNTMFFGHAWATSKIFWIRRHNDGAAAAIGRLARQGRAQPTRGASARLPPGGGRRQVVGGSGAAGLGPGPADRHPAWARSWGRLALGRRNPAAGYAGSRGWASSGRAAEAVALHGLSV